MKAGTHYVIHALFGVALTAAIAVVLWGPGYAQPAQTGAVSTTVTSSAPETVFVYAPKQGLKPFDMEECYIDGRRECRRVTCVEWATPTGWQRTCQSHDKHFP